MHTDSIKVKGTFELKLIDAVTGKVTYEYSDHNLYVDLGRSNIVHLLGGAATGHAITIIGVGLSGATPTTADTTLTSGYTKVLNSAGTVNVYTSTTIQFGYQFDTTEANGMNIREFGLFNSASVLCARKTLTVPIVKTSAFAIAGTWTLLVG